MDILCDEFAGGMIRERREGPGRLRFKENELNTESTSIAWHESARGDVGVANQIIRERWAELLADDRVGVSKALDVSDATTLDPNNPPFKAQLHARGFDLHSLAIHVVGELVDGSLKATGGYIAVRLLKLLWKERIAPDAKMMSNGEIGKELPPPDQEVDGDRRPY